jgi:hypothetical protein
MIVEKSLSNKTNVENASSVELNDLLLMIDTELDARDNEKMRNDEKRLELDHE